MSFVAEYWVTALFGFVASTFGIVLKILWNRTQAVFGGVKILLYAEIKRYYYTQKAEGWCPLYVLEDMEKMHTEYKRLGGNGALDSIMTEVRSMQKTKDD
jgi:hypothetical protein